MRTTSSFIRSAVTTAAVVAVMVGVAAPASAKKARPIVVPATAFKDATSKLCLPGSVVPNADRNAKTLCQTRDEWTAQGVAIVVK